jgi:hypothetical protein
MQPNMSANDPKGTSTLHDREALTVYHSLVRYSIRFPRQLCSTPACRVETYPGEPSGNDASNPTSPHGN